MSSKKDKPLYDENGRWVEERGRVKGAIRRTFRLSPQMKEVLQAARVELPPALKKDGTPGKKPQVRYRCAICSGLFPQKFVQVDHIEPVVPLNKQEKDMTYDEMVRRIICEVSKLQVVCSTPLKYNDNKPSCHKLKTDEENWMRRRIMELTELYKGPLMITPDLICSLRIERQKEIEEKEAKKCKKRTRKSKTAKK